MERDKGKFPKGVSGNPSGKGPMRLLTDQVRLELTQHPEKARSIARKLIELAEEGDLQAATLLFNRLEGTPTQTIEIDTTVTHLDPADRLRRLVELQSRIAQVLVADADTPSVLDLKAIPDGTAH